MHEVHQRVMHGVHGALHHQLRWQACLCFSSMSTCRWDKDANVYKPMPLGQATVAAGMDPADALLVGCRFPLIMRPVSCIDAPYTCARYEHT